MLFLPVPQQRALMCAFVVLDFIHRLNYKILKLQLFGSWILFSSPGKKEKGAENLSVGPPDFTSLR
jgi:hypothetical protein